MIGIYCILNLVNDKIYIGQSVDIERRLRSHISYLINSKHHNQYLQRAFDKYGFDNFVFSPILECNEDKLDYYEVKYILEFDSMDFNKGYNLESGGNSNKRIHPDIVKKQVDARKGWHHSPESKKRLSEANTGRKHTLEARKKISEARKGMVFTEEHKMNISLNHVDQSGENNGCWGTSKFEDYGGLDFIKEKIAEGWTQQQLGDYVGLARQTVQDYLMVRGTSWSELKEVV